MCRVKHRPSPRRSAGRTNRAWEINYVHHELRKWSDRPRQRGQGSSGPALTLGALGAETKGTAVLASCGRRLPRTLVPRG